MTLSEISFVFPKILISVEIDYMRDIPDLLHIWGRNWSWLGAIENWLNGHNSANFEATASFEVWDGLELSSPQKM